jgi:hypothetical protein
MLARFGQDDAPQPAQLGLIVALSGRRTGFDCPIECGERIIESSRLNLGLCDEAKPLGIEQVGTHAIPGG